MQIESLKLRSTYRANPKEGQGFSHLRGGGVGVTKS